MCLPRQRESSSSLPYFLHPVGARLIIMLMLLQMQSSAASCLALKKISSSSDLTPLHQTLAPLAPPLMSYAKPVLTIHVLPPTTSVLSYPILLLLLISGNQTGSCPLPGPSFPLPSHVSYPSSPLGLDFLLWVLLLVS